MNKRSNLPYSTQDLFPRVEHDPVSLVDNSRSMRSSLLVTANSDPIAPSHRHGFTPRKNIQRLKKMLRRLFKPNSLDFETAIWEIFNLIFNPRKLYRSHYYYKQQLTGNKVSYTRDDPSFLILLTGFLSISAIAWGLAYSPSAWEIIKLTVYMVMVDFYLTGVVIASIFWLVMNWTYNNTFAMMGDASRFNVNYIEWGFCFDIHCNSFIVIWLSLYLLQFILLPVLTIEKSFTSLLVGNSLYFGAVGHYFIVTMYGFTSIPFVGNLYTGANEESSHEKLLQRGLLFGILPLLAIGWLLTVVLGINVATVMVKTYFS